MRNVYHKTDAGLVAVYTGGDAASIGRLLREYDDDLRLVPQGRGDHDVILYKVYRRVSAEHYLSVLSWADNEGNPLPLSSALLDKVRELDKNSRAEYVSAEVREEERKAKLKKDQDAAIQDIYEDWATREGKSHLLPRGVSLRNARSKTGYHG